jgi:hypothetical protein
VLVQVQVQVVVREAWAGAKARRLPSRDYFVPTKVGSTGTLQASDADSGGGPGTATSLCEPLQALRTRKTPGDGWRARQQRARARWGGEQTGGRGASTGGAA